MTLRLKWVAVLGLVLAFLPIAVPIYIYAVNFAGGVTQDQDKWGQFGDFLGGVSNPVFGFLGFIALLATLYLQSQELKHSTAELAKSAEALNLQHKALLQQNFENTFFQLLRRFSDLVAEMRYQQYHGREALKQLYSEQLKSLFAQHVSANPTNAADVYETFYKQHRYMLDHYFRTLYHIFKFVDRATLREEQKISYANIARAQLSTYELCFLFYNGTRGEGRMGFRPLIERYGLLKHVSSLDLLNPNDTSNREFYAEGAFLGHAERQRSAATEQSTPAPVRAGGV